MLCRVFVRRAAGLIAAIVLLGTAAAQDASSQPETAFLPIPSAAGARASSQVLNQRYRYPGTPGDYHAAVWMRDTMRHFGLRAWIEPFTATVYTPRLLALQLLTSPPVTFDLRDGKIAADPDGSRPGVGLPFNAGSGNGDIRAPLVEAGRGLDADYARLARARVAVRGKIVLVRYGAEYRGNLAARAQSRGAAAVIFYNSPKDESPGRAYPNGPNRPPGAVQRGDVMGDDNVPLRIPTLPVTLQTAQRLIANAHGARALVHLNVQMNARVTTLWNTIGEATGSNPAQSIVLGGHRDAWVYGVTDDGSGIATLVEVARGLGALERTGWKPKRSIRIAGWDAEEIGEYGSAEYVRRHRDELQRGCIAYINVDESAAGPHFRSEAAGALVPVMVPAVSTVLKIARPPIDDPSGGSDYESFIYALGTPIINLGYGGAFGTYHSTYDDFRYAALFADPGFLHHRTIAQTVGVIALRLADAETIPYRFAPYGKSLDAGLSALTKAATAKHLTLPAELGAAIARFDPAAQAYDASASARDQAKMLRAAQELDLIAYSANGYASVAFPRIATAIGTGRQSDVDAAARETVTALSNIVSLLSVP
ncbi:MAG TPA: M28 family peptidase [Candidatus Cybelea sp.]